MIDMGDTTKELYNELIGIWSAPESVNRDITLQILRICKKAGLEFVISHGSYGYEAELEEIELEGLEG